MCAICDSVKKTTSYTEEEVQSLLDRIGELVAKGKPVEHFREAMDKLLGTAGNVDEELDELWERNRDK